MAARTRMEFLRPFTRRFVNPITRLVAGRLPGFGLLVYRGRKSGRAYRTPMNVFRRGEEYVFALTYGPEVEWVKNIMAAGECELVTGGHTLRLIGPRLFHDPTRSLMPPVVRQFLGLMRVTEFLRIRISLTHSMTPR
jgi:deazaflavin-dependent oxidoreductase (nitroreductase family)